MEKETVRITLRMPAELHAKVVKSAETWGLSLNTEIVNRVADSFATYVVEQPTLLRNLRGKLFDVLDAIENETANHMPIDRLFGEGEYTKLEARRQILAEARAKIEALSTQESPDPVKSPDKPGA